MPVSSKLGTQEYVKGKTRHEDRTVRANNFKKLKLRYSKAFEKTPSLKINIKDSGVDYAITKENKNGFEIAFFDLNGVALNYTGGFSYEAKPKGDED